jgi:hypothetical protein
VSPVRYELGFYILEDDILHSHRRENLKSYLFRDSTSHFSHSSKKHFAPGPGRRVVAVKISERPNVCTETSRRTNQNLGLSLRTDALILCADTSTNKTYIAPVENNYRIIYFKRFNYIISFDILLGPR